MKWAMLYNALQTFLKSRPIANKSTLYYKLRLSQT